MIEVLDSLTELARGVLAAGFLFLGIKALCIAWDLKFKSDEQLRSTYDFL